MGSILVMSKLLEFESSLIRKDDYPCCLTGPGQMCCKPFQLIANQKSIYQEEIQIDLTHAADLIQRKSVLFLYEMALLRILFI
jgi:hypothetical protein